MKQWLSLVTRDIPMAWVFFWDIFPFHIFRRCLEVKSCLKKSAIHKITHYHGLTTPKPEVFQDKPFP